MAREGMLIYHEYAESLVRLSDAAAGQLFKALMAYSITGDDVWPKGTAAILYPIMRGKIEKDMQRYEETCARNRQNGSLGGRPASREPIPVIRREAYSAGSGAEAASPAGYGAEAASPVGYGAEATSPVGSGAEATSGSEAEGASPQPTCAFTHQTQTDGSSVPETRNNPPVFSQNPKNPTETETETVTETQTVTETETESIRIENAAAFSLVHPPRTSPAERTTDSGTSEPRSKPGGGGTRRGKRKSSLNPQQAEGFARFWAAYPRKQSRQEAERAWAQLCPDEALTGRIVQAVGEAIRSDNRFLDIRFTPFPASWLRAGGYGDDYRGSQAGGYGRSRTGGDGSRAGEYGYRGPQLRTSNPFARILAEEAVYNG